MKIIRNLKITSRKVQILWVVDVSKPSSTPNNFSLHNINYRKLCFNEKYTNSSETKRVVKGQMRQIVLDTKIHMSLYHLISSFKILSVLKNKIFSLDFKPLVLDFFFF